MARDGQSRKAVAAVDEQLAEGCGLGFAQQTPDPLGPLEVRQHQDEGEARREPPPTTRTELPERGEDTALQGDVGLGPRRDATRLGGGTAEVLTINVIQLVVTWSAFALFIAALIALD
jgi:hypothetical protein